MKMVMVPKAVNRTEKHILLELKYAQDNHKYWNEKAVEIQTQYEDLKHEYLHLQKLLDEQTDPSVVQMLKDSIIDIELQEKCDIQTDRFKQSQDSQANASR